MKYYAANNSYGSDTSIGFANTWNVLVFDTKESRDAYVDDGNLSTRAIRRDEVTKYAANWHMNRNETIEPKPFSGEYWGICDELDYTDTEIQGYVGHIRVCDPSDRWNVIERFYKG